MNEENVPDDGIHRSYEELFNEAWVDRDFGLHREQISERVEVTGLGDEEFRPQRPLTPIEEQILHYTDETTRALAQNAWANQLRRSFASPPPMSRIEIAPNPHLPVMEFPRRPVALTDAQREELQGQIEAGFANFTEAIKGLVQVIGPAWREMIDEVSKAFQEISESLPDERDIHPGDLRDERGIKQPSHTPPFWAATPGRTSKKRGKR